MALTYRGILMTDIEKLEEENKEMRELLWQVVNNPNMDQNAWLQKAEEILSRS